MRFAGWCALAVLVAAMVGCSKKENGVSAGDGVTIEVRLMEYDAVVDTSISFELSDMPANDFDGETGVPLTEFVPLQLIPMNDGGTPDDASDDTDRRDLYAYRIIGADGYNVHDAKGYDDQRWNELQNGYIGLDSHRANFDESLGLAGSYRVTEVAAIEIYRKAEIVISGSPQLVELADLATTTFQDQPAVALTVLLADVPSPETYQYSIVAVDGYTGLSPFSWVQIQGGYWLLDSNRTAFDPDLGGKSRIRDVRSIEVVAP